MSVCRSDDFIADLERQFEWYVVNAGQEVAERYLAAVAATCQILGQHPQLGLQAGFAHPRLRDWRLWLSSLLSKSISSFTNWLVATW